MADDYVDSMRYAHKRKDLSDAITATNLATFRGQFIGAVIGLPIWWLSGAPWWGIPGFVLFVGWVCGQIYGKRVARRHERQLKSKWPELKL